MQTLEEFEKKLRTEKSEIKDSDGTSYGYFTFLELHGEEAVADALDFFERQRSGELDKEFLEKVSKGT